MTSSKKLRPVNHELTMLTENGLTVAEELPILKAEREGKVYGPFKTAKAMMKSLKKSCPFFPKSFPKTGVATGKGASPAFPAEKVFIAGRIPTRHDT